MLCVTDAARINIVRSIPPDLTDVVELRAHNESVEHAGQARRLKNNNKTYKIA